ncbi:protein FAR1-RELATED SEQUENCE 8-like [Rhododendron vialii]|uniref:protein FAR1-RELATED SEQUENCE 8-like n=1 Tax=Rhododendron vialii TaxID=182163 RepID=UPI00265F303D|nr:protein FAR1-RELATED SEQUENCE 8-like [Rhododendron vialii]
MEEEQISNVNPTPLFPPPPLQRMQSVDDIQLLSSSPSQPFEESANSSEALYTPEVKNEVIPKIAQQFKSLKDVFKAYNNYAFKAGFSVRINSSKTDKNRETIRKEYVCYKEGESKCSEASCTESVNATTNSCKCVN